MRYDSVAALEMKVMLVTTSAEWGCAKRKRTAAHEPQCVLHVPQYITVGDNSVMRHLP